MLRNRISQWQSYCFIYFYNLIYASLKMSGEQASDKSSQCFTAKEANSITEIGNEEGSTQK